LDINFVVQAPTGRLIVPDIRKKGDLHKLAFVNICTLGFAIPSAVTKINI